MDISNNSQTSYGGASHHSLGIFGKTEDYVPLFTLYRPDLTQFHLYATSYLNGEKRLLDRVREFENEGTRLEKLISQQAVSAFNREDRKAIKDNPNVVYKKTIIETKKNIIKGIYKSNWTYEIKRLRWANTSYSSLFSSIKERNEWAMIKVRSGKYVGNLGYLSSYNPINDRNESTSIVTLCSIMVKSEMIPYVRMCSLLNEPPHPDALELWVREDFDIPKGSFKNIRPHYRKNIRKVAIDEGIKIVKIPCLDSIMCYDNAPKKIRSISERKKRVEKISDEFLSSKYLEMSLRASDNPVDITLY